VVCRARAGHARRAGTAPSRWACRVSRGATACCGWLVDQRAAGPCLPLPLQGGLDAAQTAFAPEGALPTRLPPFPPALTQRDAHGDAAAGPEGRAAACRSAHAAHECRDSTRQPDLRPARGEGWPGRLAGAAQAAGATRTCGTARQWRGTPFPHAARAHHTRGAHCAHSPTPGTDPAPALRARQPRQRVGALPAPAGCHGRLAPPAAVGGGPARVAGGQPHGARPRGAAPAGGARRRGARGCGRQPAGHPQRRRRRRRRERRVAPGDARLGGVGGRHPAVARLQPVPGV
jgi:hypothetical protein